MGVILKQRDGEWWVYVNLHGRRKAKKIGRDKAAARDVAKKLEAKIALNEYSVDDDKSCPTFKEYAERWLSIPSDRKENTMEDYRRNLKQHVYPVFAHSRLDEIRRRDLKEFFDNLLLEGFQQSSVFVSRAPIADIMKHAVESEIIESSPLLGITLKRPRKNDDINPLTEEETILLLDAAKVHFNGYYWTHILCALRTGMRIGELEALQWGDIDFNGRFIKVQRSHRRGRLTDTKNRTRRRVDMSAQLVEALKAWRVFQVRSALEAGRPLPEFVFASMTGAMLHRTAFRRTLNHCLMKAKLRKP